MGDLMKDLWCKITKLHSLYIEAEDSPDKSAYETNLGALIREFLSIVPHNCKFHFKESAQILKNSILSTPDFCPFKLVSAWMAMHKYASNLLSQPWRQEFTSIKLYSGFYKHQIEPILLRGEVMLELIGYQKTDPGHLELLEPIDADNVRVVALDSLIAMVECQILGSIYEEVVKNVSSVTWRDIIEARESLAGGPEYISKQLINKLYSTNIHCRSNSYGAACSTTSCPTAMLCNGYGASMPMHTASYIPPSNMNGYYCQPYGHNAPPVNIPSGNLVDIDPPAYPRSPPGSFSPPGSSVPLRATTKPRDESWAYVLDTLDKPSTSSNNSRKYSTSNGYTDVERYTDRYNGDSAIQRERYNGDSEIQRERYNGGSASQRERYNGGSVSQRDVKERFDCDRQDRYNRNRISGNHANGEAVNFRSGDKYASTRHCKDVSTDPISHLHEELQSLRLEERGVADELDGEGKIRSKQNEREKNREEREVRTIDRRRRESERERERELRKDREKVLRDSLSPDMKYETELLESKAREEVLGHSYESGGHMYAGLRVNLTPESPLRVNLTSDQKYSRSSGGSTGSNKTNGATVTSSSWNCEFCTYCNVEGDVCVMCSKSRFKGAELKPLESGGRQCPKCTLVNDRDARVCEACSESLENSATYI